MAESPSYSDNTKSDGETSENEDLPAFGISSVEPTEVQPTVLFPPRRMSLQKITKLSRKRYSEMIEIALLRLNEARTGSSRQAIVKYIRGNYEVGENVNSYVRLALAKLIEQERVLRKSGVGASGRFVLSKEIREALLKGAKPKAKSKPKAKPKAGTKSTEKKATNEPKDEGSKSSKGRKIKKKADEDGVDSDKENRSKAAKNTKAKGAKASGSRAKKDEGHAKNKTTNKKGIASYDEEKGKGKASEKLSKSTANKDKDAKPKAKEGKAKAKEDKVAKEHKDSRGKGKRKTSVKDKGNDKETSEAPSNKSDKTKNTKKNSRGKTAKAKD